MRDNVPLRKAQSGAGRRGLRRVVDQHVRRAPPLNPARRQATRPAAAS